MALLHCGPDLLTLHLPQIFNNDSVGALFAATVLAEDCKGPLADGVFALYGARVASYVNGSGGLGRVGGGVVVSRAAGIAVESNFVGEAVVSNLSIVIEVFVGANF